MPVMQELIPLEFQLMTVLSAAVMCEALLHQHHKQMRLRH
jgi:hypothetical protein